MQKSVPVRIWVGCEGSRAPDPNGPLVGESSEQQSLLRSKLLGRNLVTPVSYSHEFGSKLFCWEQCPAFAEGLPGLRRNYCAGHQ